MLDFLIALAFIHEGVGCDRCLKAKASFAVQCIGGCYHSQCLECALYTDKDRRIECHEMADMS